MSSRSGATRVCQGATTTPARTLSGLVDAARIPFYLWRSGRALGPLSTEIVVALAGALIGTLLGERALLGLSRETFRRVVAIIVGALGLWLLWRAGTST